MSEETPKDDHLGANYYILDEVTNESDSDIPDEKVQEMLGEAWNSREKRGAEEAGLDETALEERDETVLVPKGNSHFDILPEDWIQVNHDSGMPVYLHKTSNVCTLARPYFLGPKSVKKQDIPVSAIPCLSYRRALDEEDDITKRDVKQAGIETMNDLNPEQVKEYCERLFKFQNIKIRGFKTWAERREFKKRQKYEKEIQSPTLPEGTQLISVLIQDGSGSNVHKKELIINPNGKSHVCILQEYAQRTLKVQPTYKFTELKNPATPFQATVSIKDMEYAVGCGSSKKQAKAEAAKAALEILIPEMRSKITADSKSTLDQNLSLFDEIRVEDPRVAKLCAKTLEPLPYDVLVKCLQRKNIINDVKISYTHQHHKVKFTMTVGEHKAIVVSKNKREGRQRASQAILQTLHPHISSWGSLLRLYGRTSNKFEENKSEKHDITSLQTEGAVNSPNYAMLNKLKLEFGKLKHKSLREARN